VKKLVCFVLIAGFVASGLWAQNNSTAQNGGPSLTPPDSAKLRVALELYDLMGAQKQLKMLQML